MTSALALFITAGSKLCLGLAGLLLVAGIVGSKFPLQIPIRVVGLIAVVMTVATFSFQPTVPTPNGFLFFPSLAFSAGLFSALGTAVLLLRNHKDWEEQLVLATTIVTLMAAGNTNYALPLGYALIVYTLFFLLYLRSHRFGLRLSALLSSVLTVALALGLAVLFSWGQVGFRDLISFQSWSASINFGDTAGIKPQGGAGGKKVMLRVFADAPKPYFAARRYVDYADNQWKASVGPVAHPTGTHIFPGQNSYVLRGELPENWTAESVERVEVTTNRPEALPLPLEARIVSAPLAKAHLSSCGDLLVKDTGFRFSGTYQLARGELDSDSDPHLLESCLVANVDPYVSELAHQIAGDKPDKLKIFALTQFFQQNFEYGFGYPFDQSEDPVVDFLKERPAAHCEVYATCLTLMARSVGVPARYVQGFLVRERNEWGSYWVSRERDAHAWTEVYLEGVGWVTVDATPSAVSESVESDSSWQELSDLFKRYMGRLWAHLSRGPQALLEDLLSFVSTHLLGTVLFILALIVWVKRKWLLTKLTARTASTEEEVDPVHPGVQEMRALFEDYQALVEEPKPKDVTLLEWSETVGTGGEFLRVYSEIRYSRQNPEEEDLEKLKKLLNELREISSTP